MVRRRPIRWNPVRVEVRALSEDASKIDDVFRVPRNRKVRPTTYIYNAQVNLGKKAQDRKEPQFLGDRTETSGWILLRTCDLAPNSALPKPVKGWKITKLFVGTDQEQEVDYLIKEARHESQLNGRPLLLYCPFENNIEKARGAGT